MNVALYASKKEQRRERQTIAYQTIQALPPAEQVRALFQTWSQRIPNSVWKKLGREQKHAWLGLRLERMEAALADDDMNYFADLGWEAMTHHRKSVKDLLALVRTLPGQKVLTVVFRNPFSEEEDERTVVFSYTMDAKGDVTSPTDILSLEGGLALSLHDRGGLSIRQEMSLRVQRADEQGQQVWVPQERIYGIQMRSGQWGTLSAADMKRNYNTNMETGEAMPMLAGLSFGDLSQAAQKIARGGK